MPEASARLHLGCQRTTVISCSRSAAVPREVQEQLSLQQCANEWNCEVSQPAQKEPKKLKSEREESAHRDNVLNGLDT
jgi:hypothetical protein